MDQPTLPTGQTLGRLPAGAAWVLALAAIAAAIGLRWLFDPVLEDKLPLVTLYGAVAIAVWLGGWLPGVATALVGYLACSYLFMTPRGALLPETVPDSVG